MQINQMKYNVLAISMLLILHIWIYKKENSVENKIAVFNLQ